MTSAATALPSMISAKPRTSSFQPDPDRVTPLYGLARTICGGYGHVPASYPFYVRPTKRDARRIAKYEPRTDIVLARAASKLSIQEIGAKLGIPGEHLLPAGHDSAKVSTGFFRTLQERRDGKLILVTA